MNFQNICLRPPPPQKCYGDYFHERHIETKYESKESAEPYVYTRIKKEKIHIIKKKIDTNTEVLDKNDIEVINTILDKDDLVDLILFYDAVRWRKDP